MQQRTPSVMVSALRKGSLHCLKLWDLSTSDNGARISWAILFFISFYLLFVFCFRNVTWTRGNFHGIRWKLNSLCVVGSDIKVAIKGLWPSRKLFKFQALDMESVLVGLWRTSSTLPPTVPSFVLLPLSERSQWRHSHSSSLRPPCAKGPLRCQLCQVSTHLLITSSRLTVEILIPS